MCWHYTQQKLSQYELQEKFSGNETNTDLK